MSDTPRTDYCTECGSPGTGHNQTCSHLTEKLQRELLAAAERDARLVALLRQALYQLGPTSFLREDIEKEIGK